MTSVEQHRIAEEIMRNPVSYPGLPARKANSIFRIWFYPSFSARISWSVIREKNSLFIRRIVWDQNSKSLSVEPVMYGSESKIEQELFDSLVAKLQKIHIPIFVPNNMVGLDGETRGIEIGNYMISASVSWWCEAPAEWVEVESWFKQTTELFDQFLPKYSVSK